MEEWVEKTVFSENKKKLKKEKKKKQSKDKHKKRRRNYSSDSDSSSHQERLEKKKTVKQKRKKKSYEYSTSESSLSEDEKKKKKAGTSNSEDECVEKASGGNERDEWMSMPLLFGTNVKKKQKEKPDQNKCIIEKPGQSDRELNPYWKNGGCGLPTVVKDVSLVESSVGDQGVDWLKRALQRAKETAQEDGRSLNEVVSERWGSLAKLESLINEAEDKQRKNKYGRLRNERHSQLEQNKNRFRTEKSYERQYDNNRSKRNDDNDRDKRQQLHQRPFDKDVREDTRKENVKDERYGKNKDRVFQLPSDRDEGRESSRRDNDRDRERVFQRPCDRDKGRESSGRDRERVFRRPSDRDRDEERESSGRDRERMFERPSDRDEGRESSGRDRERVFQRPSDRDRDEGRESSERDRERVFRRSSDRDRDEERESSGRDRERMFQRPSDRDEGRESSGRDRERMFQRPSDRDRDEGRESSGRDRDKDRQRLFQRPSDRDRESYRYRNDADSRDNSHKRHHIKGETRPVTSRENWRKKEFRTENNKEVNPKSKQSSDSSSSDSEVEVKKVEEVKNKVLTDEELNALAAKVVKADIMGDETLAKELRRQLDEARERKKNTPSDSRVEETIILTKVNAKGLVRPVEGIGRREPVGGRRKKEKMETHQGGERIRYFADDDKYSLKQMFESEKLNSVDNEQELFVKMMSKSKVRSASDEEDSFVENARVKESDGKETERALTKAVHESTKRTKSMEGCAWCLDSKQRAKHLVVSIADKCYLCLPQEESLTDGHCLIVPMDHMASGTLLDEDVWAEMTTFRRKLTQMFLEKEMDVVFFENARAFHKFPHTVVHCVPIEKEVGDMAPIYFKKAIQDSETEWSTNKKLIDLSKKGLRRSVPKGLPYFSVDFGNEGGFAHIIEDEQLFPPNFAQEVIGGMLDLDHRKWRKNKTESFNAQREKVLRFTSWWKQYDFTKSKMSSSSSSDDSSD